MDRPLDLARVQRLAVLLVNGENGRVGERAAEQRGARQRQQQRDRADAQGAAHGEQYHDREEQAQQHDVGSPEMHEDRTVQISVCTHEQGMGAGEEGGEGRGDDQHSNPHRADPCAEAHEGRPQHPRRIAAAARAHAAHRRRRGAAHS